MYVLLSAKLWYLHLDGLVQERCNSIANALELRLSCTNPSICNVLDIKQSGTYHWCEAIWNRAAWSFCFSDQWVGWFSQGPTGGSVHVPGARPHGHRAGTDGHGFPWEPVWISQWPTTCSHLQGNHSQHHRLPQRGNSRGGE